MTNHKKTLRSSDGSYHVGCSKYRILNGSREQVHNGTAYKTPGGLLKCDLVRNKWGRIVSKAKHITAKKEKRLQKFGYFAEKGKFGYVKKTPKNRRTAKKA